LLFLTTDYWLPTTATGAVSKPQKPLHAGDKRGATASGTMEQ
jgi:hypothetical protein